jgi:hypothetical protein
MTSAYNLDEIADINMRPTASNTIARDCLLSVTNTSLDQL